MGRAVAVEEKAGQKFIFIENTFLELYLFQHPLNILNTVQRSVSGATSKLIVFPVLEDNALLQQAKAVILKLTNPTRSLLYSLPKHCG